MRVEALTHAEREARAEGGEQQAAHAKKLQSTEDAWRGALLEQELKASEQLSQRDADLRELRLKVNEMEFTIANAGEKLSRQDEASALAEADSEMLQAEAQALRAKLKEAERRRADETREALQERQTAADRTAQAETLLREQVSDARFREEAMRALKEEAAGEAETLRAAAASLKAELAAQGDASAAALAEARSALDEEVEAARVREAGERAEAARRVQRLEEALKEAAAALAQAEAEHEAERTLLEKQHAREAEEAKAAVRRAEEDGHAKGVQKAERTAGEKVRMLQASNETLRTQKKQDAVAHERVRAKHEAQAEQWAKDFAREKQEHQHRMSAQQTEMKAQADRLHEQVQTLTRTGSEDRRSLSHLEGQLAGVKQELLSAKAEASLQLSQADIRVKDQESWRRQQLDDEKKRREHAEEELATARAAATKLEAAMNASEARAQQKATRLERQHAAATRDVAAARAKAEALAIQLEERERALRGAGQRLASAAKEQAAAASPSPRRRASDEGGAEVAAATRMSVRAQSVELELQREKTLGRENVLRVQQLQDDLEQARRDAEAAEASAQHIADEHERIERGFKEMHRDIVALKSDLEESRNALRETEAARKQEAERAATELKDVRLAAEVAATRHATEAAALKKAARLTEAELGERAKEAGALRDQLLEEGRRAAERRRGSEAELEKRETAVRGAGKQLAQRSEALLLAEGRAQSLMAELERLKTTHAQTLRELAAAQEETRRAAGEVEELKGKCLAAGHEATQTRRAAAQHEAARKKEEEKLRKEAAAARREAEAASLSMSATKDRTMGRLQQEGDAVRARLRRVEAEQCEYRTRVRQLEAEASVTQRESEAVKRSAAEAEAEADRARGEAHAARDEEARLRREAGGEQHARRFAEAHAEQLAADLRTHRKQASLAEGAAHRLVHEAEAEKARTNAAWERAHVSSLDAALAERREAGVLRTVASVDSHRGARGDLAGQIVHLSSATKALSDLVTPPRETPAKSYLRHTLALSSST